MESCKGKVHLIFLNSPESGVVVVILALFLSPVETRDQKGPGGVHSGLVQNFTYKEIK